MSEIKNEIKRKYTYIYLILLVVGLRILIKIFQLITFEHDIWQQKAEQLNFEDVTIEAKRGDIYARDDRLLVSSVPYFQIHMDMIVPALSDREFFDNVDSLATCLANLFNDASDSDYRSKGEWMQYLIKARKKGEQYHLIKRKVNYREYKVMKSFPIFKRGRIKGGFIAEQHIERNKLFKNLAARTIGRVKNKAETRNIVGIEGAYDHELKGIDGFSVMQRLYSGQVLMPIDEKGVVEPVDGRDVVTTLDINIQDVTENALLEQLKYNQADFGTAIVMEVKTGHILAIANLVDTLGDYHEAYNYAIGYSAAPGSTFKLMSLIAGLEDGYISLNEIVDTEGGIKSYHGFRVRDSRRGGYGRISVAQAFEVSSNVGISKIIYKYYKNRPEKFIDRLYSMNLNNPLGIEILGEANPYIKYPGDRLWSKVSLPQMSIGYEIELTPLQILTFYNAVANNGRMMKPLFVKEIREHGSIVKEFNPKIINPAICSKANIKKARTILEGVVQEGTAKGIKNDNYKIAGKTGTAKIYDKEHGYVSRYRASFAGYFPADRPKYSCIVMIYNPKRNGYYGASVAAPVFRKIADKIFPLCPEFHEIVNKEKKPVYAVNKIPYSKHGLKTEIETVLKGLHIPRQHRGLSSPWVVTEKHDSYVEFHDRIVDSEQVPSVKGMGIKDAVSILEKLGLQVRINGRGAIVEQSIEPGTSIKPGDEILLTMSKI